jgi:hypothetical protein
MTVRKIVATAFSQGFLHYPNEHKEWIRISFRIGGNLPGSLLVSSVQKAGQLDLLIKCMEDEFSPDKPDDEPDFSFHSQVLLSELWVGHVYEIFRLLKERKCAPNHPDFESLAHDLRLLRIPLEKHEIPGDRKLKEPLLMEKHPSRKDDNIYQYSKDDLKRSHIMPTGVSQRGSVMWHVTDIISNKSYWIERQQLSERIFALYSDAESNKCDT